MAELPGICGAGTVRIINGESVSSRPCKISHSSSYPNQIGIYPSEFLPSIFTIWHAVFASQFPLSQPLITPGALPPIGGGILDGLGGLLFPTLPTEHDFQSHHHIIFARTANRINVAYTLTQADIDNIDSLGVAEVDIGEFVFEVVAVTSEPMDVSAANLGEQEIEDLEDDSECTAGCTAESQEDREFRKLFEIPIQNEAGQSLTNRFVGMVFNKQGVEYRLDNGTRKSRLALDQSGLGDLDNPSYRDGTSRKIKVQLTTFDGEGVEQGEGTEEGNVIYLTYVAVREHYLRQRVVISWTVIDPGTAEGPGAKCISFAVPGGFNVSHFRFYEWDMEAEPGLLPTRLSGWRAVESFRADVNFVAPILVNNIVQLADFPIGAAEFTRDFSIIQGKASPSELDAFILDRNATTAHSPITVTIDGLAPQGGEFHTNAGIDGNNSAFRATDWFERNQFSKHSSRDEAHNHVFFNVHPLALRKRDVDKWGIERFLAVELEKDINAGKLTFFPFMDDPDVDNPTLGARVALDSSNTRFHPVEPVSLYGGNFEAVCGSVGSFPTNPSDGINSYHSFESNRITEKFESDTRVLVERNFATGAGPLGPNLITIEGREGGSRGSVTCISDPSKEFQFAGHTNADGFLIYNSFSSGHTNEALRSLAFRPDTESPPFKGNSDPSTSQFDPLVGFSGMIGDIPGIQPGRAVAIASYAQPDSFFFKTTEPDELPAFVQEEQIENISLPEPGSSPLVIPLSNTYYGSLTIKYKLREEAESLDSSTILLAKVGDAIEGIVDGNVILSSTRQDKIATLNIYFKWLRASTFELRGDRVEHMEIKSIAARSINPDQLNNFLNEQNSHTLAFAQSPLDDRMTDRSLFFATDVVTMSEDEHSNMYIFFNDADGGISAVATNDFGGSWHYYYGVVEKLGDREAKDPFAVTHFTSNNCFLFYRLGGNKVMCKKIPYSLFAFRDSNLIERFSADVFVAGDGEDLPRENQSIYSDKGKILRRSLISYIVAGDMTDESFLELIGKVPGEFEYVPNETRIINGEQVTVRKNPVARSPGTAFNNINITSIFFSAYRKDNGELRFWYLSPTEDSDNISQLQCHFSADDGQTWFDLWEFIQNGYNRLRHDTEKKTQFIDRSASGTEAPDDLKGTDPQEGGRDAQFGVNIHWSRLARHKIDQEGEASANSESQVLEVSSPYVFYQPSTERVFLFYVYQGCLLCKMFNDSIFGDAAARREDENFGMTRVKSVIERQTKAHFIDGSLSSAALREEIHGFANADTEEIMADGNIIFRYPFASDNFTEDRVVPSQRICATDLSTGLIRVFYKHDDSVNLKSAIWTGVEWWAEDFLRNPKGLTPAELPDNSSFARVLGGFGGTGFT